MAIIRPGTESDAPTLAAIALRTGFFRPVELEALHEVLADYFAANHAHGHQLVVAEADGQPVGFAYYAPASMTDRTWDLWWLAVEPARQGQGYGRSLLESAEAEMRAASARLLLVDTSSTDLYSPTRRFYLAAGYDPVAEVPDFYADGDGKVIFAKRLD